MMSTRRGKEWAAQNFRGHLGWVLSLFLVGLGAKFLMILQSNSPLPYYDQWEGEAVDTYVPYYEHALALVDLFKAHNEHRIFFTRVYDLMLLLLNGQWDSQLQMTLNAGLHCAAIAGFGWLMAGLLGKARWPLIWPPLALALVLPFGWENTLWAFQSPFYFMLIFSLLTMWWLGLGEPFSVRWKLGVATGVMALFTMASGFMAAAAAAALCLADILKDKRNWRRQMPTLIACGVLIALGLLLKTDVPRHHQLQAQTLRDFVMALGKNLAWPWAFQPWFAPLNVLVFALLGWVYWRSPRDQPMPAERMILMTGLWSLLQSVAAAYARGVGGVGPAWRYMDVTSLFMIANWLGIVALLTRHRRQLLRLRAALVCGFCGLDGDLRLAGFWPLTRLARLNEIPSWAVRQGIRLETTRAFMATDNEHVFDNEDVKDLPFPYVPEYVFLLRTEDIRRILPACARDPLKLVKCQGTDDGGFCREREPFDPDGIAIRKMLGLFFRLGRARARDF